MERYILMNQNKEVLKFEFDKDLNVITDISEIYDLDYAPLNIKNILEVPCVEYLQKMFILDYIMLNEDRHLNNFGVIRDVKTLEWKQICPIFDTGRSMNTNVTISYWDLR